jgi:tRNA(Ile)-lysidine synthase
LSISSKIISRCLATIKKHSLISRADRVLVGLSGGPDSTALMHILHRLQDKLDISLAGIYLNHMLRPRSAKKEAEFCRVFCDGISVLYIYEEADVADLAAMMKTGIEETAREVRYSVYEAAARRGGFTKIAVGHHRDDRVETILFNLFRGAGRQGIIGLQPKRANIIRPLYDISHKDILAYLKENKVEYMFDSSNRSPKFTRNRIRNRVIPLIEKEVSSKAVDNVLRYSRIIADEDAFLHRLARETYEKLVQVSPGGKFSLDLTDKLKYDIWLWRRLVIYLLSAAGLFDIAYEDVERIIDLIHNNGRTRRSLRYGLHAEIAGKALFVYRTERKVTPIRVAVPGHYQLDYPHVRIDLSLIKHPDRSARNSAVAIIDADQLEGALTVTGIKPGMRFHPYGRPGSKKVGDFLTDRKYPRPLRDELLVLCDQNGVVWVAGLEIDHRVRVQSSTKRVARIEVKRS